MNESDFPIDSLVIYKKRPARVVKSGERLEIEMDDGNRARVRSKDVSLLHPGPVRSLTQLQPQAGEVELAWQILLEGGQAQPLAELAELIYGAYTPATAWAAWGWIEDGLFFQGGAETVTPRTQAEVENERASRQARQAEAQAWAAFLERARGGKISLQDDVRYLRELENLVFGRSRESKLLRELGHSERPENAHRLLLEWNAWDATVNPYPARLGLTTRQPVCDLPALPEEDRLDLTHLDAFAIDDRGNQDPDDAVSLVECRLDEGGNFLGGRLWVHVADAAAMVPADSPADLEARARGATLYLPEGPVLMLPEGAIHSLGLGLGEVSPALSFDIELDQTAKITAVEIRPSWVRARRLSYEQAEELIDCEPLRSLDCLTRAYLRRRQADGAFLLDLPEVMMRISGGEVIIEPILRLRSRDLVREAMLMAGEAAAQFALRQNIPFPFVTQEASNWGAMKEGNASLEVQGSLSQRFALRRTLKRSQVSSLPGRHAGVGLDAYCRVTSPLRRYLDLVAHQQLRAWLAGKPILKEQALLERLGAAEAITGTITQAEMLSRRHWTLVHLQMRPEWQGEGVLVEKTGMRGYVLIPELAFETPMHLREDLPLDSRLMLRARGINLAELEVHFVCE
jgi:exoribonuclease-2